VRFTSSDIKAVVSVGCVPNFFQVAIEFQFETLVFSPPFDEDEVAQASFLLHMKTRIW
jgi:hypothetical protein